MILNLKRFIINNFGLPVDRNTLGLLDINAPKAKEEDEDEVICIKSDHEDSFLGKINPIIENQLQSNSKKPVSADKKGDRKKTRIYVVEGDQETILSKLKDISLNSLILNKTKDILGQTKNKDFEIYSLGPSTLGENEINLNLINSEEKIVYSKSGENDC